MRFGKKSVKGNKFRGSPQNSWIPTLRTKERPEKILKSKFKTFKKLHPPFIWGQATKAAMDFPQQRFPVNPGIFGKKKPNRHPDESIQTSKGALAPLNMLKLLNISNKRRTYTSMCATWQPKTTNWCTASWSNLTAPLRPVFKVTMNKG